MSSNTTSGSANEPQRSHHFVSRISRPPGVALQGPPIRLQSKSITTSQNQRVRSPTSASLSVSPNATVPAQPPRTGLAIPESCTDLRLNTPDTVSSERTLRVPEAQPLTQVNSSLASQFPSLHQQLPRSTPDNPPLAPATAPPREKKPSLTPGSPTSVNSGHTPTTVSQAPASTSRPKRLPSTRLPNLPQAAITQLGGVVAPPSLCAVSTTAVGNASASATQPYTRHASPFAFPSPTISPQHSVQPAAPVAHTWARRLSSAASSPAPSPTLPTPSAFPSSAHALPPSIVDTLYPAAPLQWSPSATLRSPPSPYPHLSASLMDAPVQGGRFAGMAAALDTRPDMSYSPTRARRGKVVLASGASSIDAAVAVATEVDEDEEEDDDEADGRNEPWGVARERGSAWGSPAGVVSGDGVSAHEEDEEWDGTDMAADDTVVLTQRNGVQASGDAGTWARRMLRQFAMVSPGDVNGHAQPRTHGNTGVHARVVEEHVASAATTQPALTPADMAVEVSGVRVGSVGGTPTTATVFFKPDQQPSDATTEAVLLTSSTTASAAVLPALDATKLHVDNLVGKLKCERSPGLCPSPSLSPPHEPHDMLQQPLFCAIDACPPCACGHCWDADCALAEAEAVDPLGLFAGEDTEPTLTADSPVVLPLSAMYLRARMTVTVLPHLLHCYCLPAPLWRAHQPFFSQLLLAHRTDTLTDTVVADQYRFLAVTFNDTVSVSIICDFLSSATIATYLDLTPDASTDIEPHTPSPTASSPSSSPLGLSPPPLRPTHTPAHAAAVSPPGPRARLSACAWAALCLSEGDMTTFTVESGLVSAVSTELASNGFPILYFSSHPADYVLVRADRLWAAIRCLTRRFSCDLVVRAARCLVALRADSEIASVGNGHDEDGGDGAETRGGVCVVCAHVPCCCAHTLVLVDRRAHARQRTDVKVPVLTQVDAAGSQSTLGQAHEAHEADAAGVAAHALATLPIKDLSLTNSGHLSLGEVNEVATVSAAAMSGAEEDGGAEEDALLRMRSGLYVDLCVGSVALADEPDLPVLPTATRPASAASAAGEHALVLARAMVSRHRRLLGYHSSSAFRNTALDCRRAEDAEAEPPASCTDTRAHATPTPVSGPSPAVASANTCSDAPLPTLPLPSLSPAASQAGDFSLRLLSRTLFLVPIALPELPHIAHRLLHCLFPAPQPWPAAAPLTGPSAFYAGSTEPPHRGRWLRPSPRSLSYAEVDGEVSLLCDREALTLLAYGAALPAPSFSQLCRRSRRAYDAAAAAHACPNDLRGHSELRLQRVDGSSLSLNSPSSSSLAHAATTNAVRPLLPTPSRNALLAAACRLVGGPVQLQPPLAAASCGSSTDAALDIPLFHPPSLLAHALLRMLRPDAVPPLPLSSPLLSDTVALALVYTLATHYQPLPALLSSQLLARAPPTLPLALAPRPVQEASLRALPAVIARCRDMLVHHHSLANIYAKRAGSYPEADFSHVPVFPESASVLSSPAPFHASPIARAPSEASDLDLLAALSYTSETLCGDAGTAVDATFQALVIDADDAAVDVWVRNSAQASQTPTKDHAAPLPAAFTSTSAPGSARDNVPGTATPSRAPAPPVAWLGRTWRCLLLDGYWALDSVGIVRALSTPITNASICPMYISTYYTDMLLVPQPSVVDAVKILRRHFRVEATLDEEIAGSCP